MRAIARVAAAVLLVGLTGCFELSPPVEESLSLTFLPDGAVKVAVETLIADPRQRFEGNPAALDRIRETRGLYAAGLDPWVRRFESLEWERETLLLEKAGGGLVRVRREGLTKSPSQLSRFFADLPLAASYERGEGFAEFSLLPLSSSRAHRQEREAFAALTEPWVALARAYERKLADLYSYLATHPDRVRPCLAEVYETCLSEEDKGAKGELSPEEEALLEELGEPMGKLLEFVEVKAGQEWSADELSRRVHDPFPGRVELFFPGELLEVQGFSPATPTSVSHEGIGIWRAMGKLEGSFVFPDPLPPLLRCLREEEGAKGLRLEALTAAPRRAGPVPTEEEVRALLTAALTPAPLYRVRWREG